MATDLARIFAGLSRTHFATPAAPVPQDLELGVTWVVAANGVWKCGRDADKEILICVQPVEIGIPGLTRLVPHIYWWTPGVRVPGVLLGRVLEHARQAGACEQQYFLTYRGSEAIPFRAVLPPQEAGATRVRYAALPPSAGTVLVDIHSHHTMDAFFSRTDDADDTGLSISAVIGRIFDRPQILVRANVYGHRQVLPASVIFDPMPAGWRDLGGCYADPIH